MTDEDVRFNVTFNWPSALVVLFDGLASKHTTSKAVLSEAMVMAFRDLPIAQQRIYVKERNDLRVTKPETK